MAIAVTTPAVYPKGFICNATSANASGGETIKAGVTGKKIKISHVTFNNLTAGALNFTLSGAAALIGPVSVGANSSLQWDFNPQIALATAQALTCTVDSGSICIFVTGVVD